MESHFDRYGSCSRESRRPRGTDRNSDETAGQSETQTNSAEPQRFDEYGNPSATGYTVDEMLQRFRQWANKTGIDLNELHDDRLYDMMTDHLYRKQNMATGQGDDEWELPRSDDHHTALAGDEEEKRQAAEWNSYIGLPPPYEGQPALSRRSKTKRHLTRGVTTRVGVHKDWNCELVMEFPQETIWASLPTGGSTDIWVPRSTIAYRVETQRLFLESPDKWLASLTIPQVIDSMLPDIPMDDKIARSRTAMSMAQTWSEQKRREYLHNYQGGSHSSRRRSNTTFSPPPRSAAPRVPPFCDICGELDCWGC
ncbi:hypothetical protein I204_01407 [Kwoniella mangroviensis CBS 8886]|uniref:uncharacterized protein n=1 Tax=Kwoniella mangroviensis CBS 8507 TaxID=1296122 RepID=UPI00080CD713|nr:uncharacterized protein I203_06025 [Kwoniella mangroviensis CBS 8507]OCF64781.1 hypothetical protein I203_06025 [Kwoniella mangroviensis CBS 8507]OCF77419.1 hypothetical protein I204_01407 [Kwoniella mangroviensis CBS 8886]